MSTTFDHGYALLIAVNESVANAALPDVIKDVKALEQVLISPERCAYKPEHIKVIAGKDSTREGIIAGLDWLKDMLIKDESGNATAVIYYTGHGHIQDGVYCLIPYDLNRIRIKTSAIRAEDFAGDIAALQPKRLLVMLDCCHAAGMEVKDVDTITSVGIPSALFMKGEKGVSTLEGGKGLASLTQGAGRAVLSSSQGSEKSWVRKDRAMSIFTYHLIEALSGHAQPQAGATEVLVSDVMSHVWRTVPASAKADHNANQHPDYKVSGNFPIAMLLGGKGLSMGESAPDPLQPPPAPQPSVSYQATNTGPGAIAQGPGATAIGAGGVYVGGKNRGNINTGTQVSTGGGAYVAGNVNAGGDFVGRDKITSGVSSVELAALFGQLTAAVVQHAPTEKRADAVQAVQTLQAEVAKGKQADDNKIARIIDGLAGMAPGAIDAVVSTFANFLLSGIAGNATKFVLDKLQGN